MGAAEKGLTQSVGPIHDHLQSGGNNHGDSSLAGLAGLILRHARAAGTVPGASPAGPSVKPGGRRREEYCTAAGFHTIASFPRPLLPAIDQRPPRSCTIKETRARKIFQTVGFGLSPWCAPPRGKTRNCGVQTVFVHHFRQHLTTTTARKATGTSFFRSSPMPHASTDGDSAQDPDVTTGTSFRSRKHANGVVDGVFMTKSDSRNPRHLGENPGQPRHPCGRAYPGPHGLGDGALA